VSGAGETAAVFPSARGREDQPHLASALPVSRRRGLLRRMAANRGALVGLILLSLLVIGAVLGPLFTDDPNAQDVRVRLTDPNSTYWFGTDELGRDLFSRVINGARISLLAGAVSVAIGLSLGTLVGTVAGYVERWPGTLLMAGVDLLLALPSILLAITITARIGAGLSAAMIAAGFVGLPAYARLARGSTLSVKRREFVDAARASGASGPWILRRHILPNIVSPLIVQATIGIGNAILLVAALGFLGLGAQAPTAEWGRLLADAQRLVLDAPYTGLFPGLALSLTILAFNLAGDGLREALGRG
jgi:ABC-type dipeptide/oligopeptide/nickel transport system permease subunit